MFISVIAPPESNDDAKPLPAAAPAVQLLAHAPHA
jgi:hypothetical protein